MPTYEPYQYLPNAYKCAIERLDCDAGLRSIAMIRYLCDAYATSSGLPDDEAHKFYTDSAVAICERRFAMRY